MFVFPVAMPSIWRPHSGLNISAYKRSQRLCLRLGSQQIGTPDNQPWSYQSRQHRHWAGHPSSNSTSDWESSSTDATQAAWSVSWKYAGKYVSYLPLLIFTNTPHNLAFVFSWRGFFFSVHSSKAEIQLNTLNILCKSDYLIRIWQLEEKSFKLITDSIVTNTWSDVNLTQHSFHLTC